ncbi:DUF4150 domain-containing protein [Archangium violaceum]|uniref:DUF4150 domain-containing protein n=1 Tax=Archangium violaceum TaxID=83451 RepID=UPI000949840D|nr:DUF4150 domain-containing protein [Archangium violaceum]
MGKKVFANGMEIAHKAGDAKVISAFPDVCLSPPPPPTGPVPVPYPNTSFARDLKQGSTSVTIGGEPLALKGKSYYQSSPLGDEAATRNFGGSVLTHTITGKTYFQAHSMDVMVEGKNVCRHLDITTSNHASYPGSTPPMPNAEEMIQLALKRAAEKKCPCCGKTKCKAAFQENETPQSLEDFYGFNEKGPDGNPTPEAADKMKVYQTLLGMKAKNCTCNGRVFPEAPCDVFRAPNPGRTKKIKEHWEQPEVMAKFYTQFTTTNPNTISDFRAANPAEAPPSAGPTFSKTNHLTPKGAGGCPDNPGNLQPHDTLCATCKVIDDTFGKWQDPNIEWRNKKNGWADFWNKAFRASGIKRRRVAGFTPGWW